MLQLPDHWVWDFWTAYDGHRHHAYYLVAPHSLGDERRRHRHAEIGHSSSTDLRHWVHHGTVLAPRGDGFDSTATWTGSVVQAPDGSWRMFYTGSRFLLDEPSLRNVQTVGVAVSRDLSTWRAVPQPVAVADRRWYEVLDTSSWPEEAWRDPWVYPAADGSGWHMLTTARAARSCAVSDDDAGVIGHAWSPDLERWQVSSPRSIAGAGFGHLEVPQVVSVYGRSFLIFSCPTVMLSAGARNAGRRGGVWSVPVEDPAGPFDVAQATLLLDESFYSGRVVVDGDRGPQLLAVVNTGTDGEFIGVLSDPMPVVVGPDGLLAVLPEHVSAGYAPHLTQ